MRKIYIFFFWALVACFIMTCFVRCFNSQPVIVFIGGGSAKKFIDDRYDVNIDEFPRSFYLNLPSSDSWLPLVEEIEKYGEEENNTMRTTIICLSADSIKPKDSKLKHHNDIFKKNRIIGVHLGDDPLCLYTNSPSICSEINNCSKTINNNKCINISGLDTVLKEKVEVDSIRIYTTKKGSGTFQAYEKIIDSTIFSELGKDIFYDSDNKEKFDTCNKQLIFLGSEYYKPNNLDSLKCFYIIDTSSQKVTKPICIYFATYKNRSGGYSISAPVVNFLSHFKDSINTKVWKKIKRRGNWLDEAKKLEHNKKDSVIYLNKEEDNFLKRSSSTQTKR